MSYHVVNKISLQCTAEQGDSRKMGIKCFPTFMNGAYRCSRTSKRNQKFSPGCSWIHPPGLPRPAPGINPVSRQQVRLRPLLNNPASLHHQDSIHPRDRPQPVRDSNHGFSPHHAMERLLDGCFGLGIQGGCRLVKLQNRRVLKNHPRQRHPLPLSFTPRSPACALYPVRRLGIPQAGNEFMRPSLSGGPDHLFLGRVQTGIEMLSKRTEYTKIPSAK